MEFDSIGFTGLSSYVGSALLARLKEVNAKDCLYLGRKPVNGFGFVPFDLREEPGNLPPLKYFVHIASFIPENQSEASDYISIENINGGGMVRLLDSLNKKELSLFINISSSHIFNSGKRNTISNVYEGSKLSAELTLKSFSYLFGFTYLNLRLSYVYGPFMKHGKLFKRIIEAALNNQDILLNNHGKDEIFLIYVDDVVDAILTSLQSKNISGDFDICSMTSVSLQEIAESVIELTNSKSEIKYVKLSSQAKHDPAPETTHESIGFKSKTSLREGLKSILEIEYN